MKGLNVYDRQYWYKMKPWVYCMFTLSFLSQTVNGNSLQKDIRPTITHDGLINWFEKMNGHLLVSLAGVNKVLGI